MKLARMRLLLVGISIVTLGSGCIAYAHYKDNSPEKNKRIEIKAFEEKNPAICQKIKGNSYYFGGTDEPMAISQSQARRQCEQNIVNGTEPYLIGI